MNARTGYFSGATLALLLVAGACQLMESAPRDERLMAGVIDTTLGVRFPVQAPATARSGVAFTITVTTFGSSSCTRAGGAEIQVSDMVANVTPMDWRPADPMTACTRDLASFPREVTLRFDQVGEATIRVHGWGRVRVQEGLMADQMITIEQRVRIEP